MSDNKFNAEEIIEEETIIHRRRVQRTANPEVSLTQGEDPLIVDATSVRTVSSESTQDTTTASLPPTQNETTERRQRMPRLPSLKTPDQQRLTKIFNLTHGTVGRAVDISDVSDFAHTKTLATLAYALTHEKSITKAATNDLFLQAVQTLYRLPSGQKVPTSVLRRDWNESLFELVERRPLIRADLSSAESRGLTAVSQIKGIPARFILIEEVQELLETTPQNLFSNIYRKRHAGKEAQDIEAVFHDVEVQRYYRALRRINGQGIEQSWQAFKEDWNTPISQVVLKPALQSDESLQEMRRKMADLNEQKSKWTQDNKELREQLFKPIPTTAGGKTLKKLMEENAALQDRTETEKAVWAQRNNMLRQQLNQPSVKQGKNATIAEMKAENATLKETLNKAQQGIVRSIVHKNEKEAVNKKQAEIRFLEENRDNHTPSSYIPAGMPTVFDVDTTWAEMDQEEEQARLSAMEQERDNHDMMDFIPNAMDDGRFDLDAVWAEMDQEEALNKRIDELNNQTIVPESAAQNLTSLEFRNIHDYQDIEEALKRKVQQRQDSVQPQPEPQPEPQQEIQPEPQPEPQPEQDQIQYADETLRQYYETEIYRNALFKATDYESEGDDKQDFEHFCHYWKKPFKTYLSEQQIGTTERDAYNDKSLVKLNDLLRGKSPSILGPVAFHKNYDKTMGDIILSVPLNQRSSLMKFAALSTAAGIIGLSTLVAFFGFGKKDRKDNQSTQLPPVHMVADADKEQEDETKPAPEVVRVTKPITRVASPTPSGTIRYSNPTTARAWTPMPRMSGTRLVQANWTAFPLTGRNRHIPVGGKDQVIIQNEYSFFLETMKRNNVGISDAIGNKLARNQIAGPRISVYTVDGIVIDRFTVDNMVACADMIDNYRHNMKSVLSGMTPAQQIRYMEAVGPSIGFSTQQQETWQAMNPNETALALKTISQDIQDRRLSNPNLSLFDATVGALSDFRNLHPENKSLSLIGYQVLTRHREAQIVKTQGSSTNAPDNNALQQWRLKNQLQGRS